MWLKTYGAFLFIGLLSISSLVYSDDEAEEDGQLSITQVEVVYPTPDSNGVSGDDEILLIKGYKLCEISSEGTQVVTLGTTEAVDTLVVKNCAVNTGGLEGLDQLEAIIPADLPAASYRLRVNNDAWYSEDDDDSDDEYTAVFDFAYGTALRADLQAEAAARAENDALLQEAINSEAAARSASDARLQANLEEEAKTRQAADTAEAMSRAAADLAERSARVAADMQEAMARIAADKAEAAARISSDQVLEAGIAQNASDITHLDHRVTDLEGVVGELSSRVDTLAFSVQDLNHELHTMNGRIESNELELRDITLQIVNLGSGLTALTGQQAALRQELRHIVGHLSREITALESESIIVNRTLNLLSKDVREIASQLDGQLRATHINKQNIAHLGFWLSRTTTRVNSNLLAVNSLTNLSVGMAETLSSQSKTLANVVKQLDDHDARIASLELSVANSRPEFVFIDTPEDDLQGEELANFFLALGEVTPGHYIFFELHLAVGPTSGAWCSIRADWYVNQYLSGYQNGSQNRSGEWKKWNRSRVSDWVATTSAHNNYFGPDCNNGLGGWCSEQGLGGRFLGFMPHRTGHELYAHVFAEGALRIRIAPTRAEACGF